MTKSKILAGVALVGLVVLGASELTRSAPRRQQQGAIGPQNREQHRHAEEVRRKDGIKAAAKLYGKFTSAESVDTDIAMPADIAAIAARTDAIVRGKVLSNLSHISEDGKWVVSDYTLQVLESLDGKLKAGDVVPFRIPGGRVEFEDGSSAEILTSGFRRPFNNREYLLFLRRAIAPREGIRTHEYELAWGSNGAFELNADGNVQPLGPRIYEVAKQYTGKSVSQLLEDIQTAVAKRAQKEK